MIFGEHIVATVLSKLVHAWLLASCCAAGRADTQQPVPKPVRYTGHLGCTVAHEDERALVVREVGREPGPRTLERPRILPARTDPSRDRCGPQIGWPRR